MYWKIRATLAVVIGGVGMSGLQAQENVGGTVQKPAPIIVGNPPKSNASTGDISYFIGFDFGSRLSGQKFTDKELDIKELTAGIMDALAKKDIRLTDEQVTSCVSSLEVMMQKKSAEMQQEFLELAKANLAKANQYLEENKKKDGVQTTKTGLQYKVIKSGTGKQPTVADEVIIHYEGKTVDGKVFDSSIQRNEPARFPVQRVVSGFSEALQRMKVGDKWQVTIPPALGYREQGSPPAIGPNETLIFEIELLEVVN
jgi:FKBP-type peptidyl-prolyl cis-trans isomerase FklB